MSAQNLKARRTVSLIAVIEAVEYCFDVTEAQLNEKRGPWRVCQARFALWWAALEVTDLTQSELAREFGRDHGTVSYGVQQCRDRMSVDPRFAQQMEFLRDGLRRGVY